MTTRGCSLLRGAFIVMVTLLAGCVSVGVPKSSTQLALPAASPPNWMAGDRTYYTNGRTERVQELQGDLAVIKRSKHLRYGLSRLQLITETFRISSNKQSKTTILRATGTLWPMRVGNRLDFLLQKDTLHPVSAELISSRQQLYSCTVDSAEPVTVTAGSFDTYRINCTRSTASRAFREQIYLYYSPALGQTVLRLEQQRYGEGNRLELSAFKPALASLSRGSRKRFRKNFQKVMENLPSGEKSVWRSNSTGTAITVTPLQTLQDQSGSYCRHYTMTINTPDYQREGAGLVCRNSKGRWSVPDKVDGATSSTGVGRS